MDRLDELAIFVRIVDEGSLVRALAWARTSGLNVSVAIT